MQQIKEMPNVIKISAKITTMQNLNILRFVCSLSLTSLKLCTVDLSTIKHEHSKKLTRWIEANWTKNTWKMQLVCKSLFIKSVKKVFKMFTICTDTCLETLSLLVNCSVNNDLSEIGPYRHTTIKHFFSTLRTVNKQKAKCWYFAWS